MKGVVPAALSLAVPGVRSCRSTTTEAPFVKVLRMRPEPKPTLTVCRSALIVAVVT